MAGAASSKNNSNEQGPGIRGTKIHRSTPTPTHRTTTIRTTPPRAQRQPRTTPLTRRAPAPSSPRPAHGYAGWVAAAVAPLEEFVDEPINPREIAEGESGSAGACVLVSIKSVALIPDYDDDGPDEEGGVGQSSWASGGSWRCCGAVVRACAGDGWAVCGFGGGCAVDLMERNLANMVGLVEKGLRQPEPRIIAEFASDKHRIAHRGLRSDNLLLNGEGALNLTDFSNAVLVNAGSPRCAAYDALKVDVWSVGAPVWELAEARPPFSDTEPPVSELALYPPAFHEHPSSSAHADGRWQLLSRCQWVHGHRAGAAGQSLPHDARPSSTDAAPRTSSSFLLRCTPAPSSFSLRHEPSPQPRSSPDPQNVILKASHDPSVYALCAGHLFNPNIFSARAHSEQAFRAILSLSNLPRLERLFPGEPAGATLSSPTRTRCGFLYYHTHMRAPILAGSMRFCLALDYYDARTSPRKRPLRGLRLALVPHCAYLLSMLGSRNDFSCAHGVPNNFATNTPPLFLRAGPVIRRRVLHVWYLA
ncbi:hypothetical protein C8J57DRAFT_1526999 [Mycena rebaudengoi]|nr:hypothetical protein C8J57DRAFT_1526999 [Mycena rebaudengoi]